MKAFSTRAAAATALIGLVLSGLLAASPVQAQDVVTQSYGTASGTVGPTSTPDLGVATKGVVLSVAGHTVNIPQASKPVLTISASSSSSIPNLTMTTFDGSDSGENGCSVGDDPAGAGTLNRSFAVVVQAGGTATVNATLAYDLKDMATGITTHQSSSFSVPVASPPTNPTSVPASICVG